MHVKVAGAQATKLQLTLPKSGAWQAIVDLDASTAPSGLVTLTIGDSLSFVGTVIPSRTGVYLGHAHALIVGGAGRLAETIDGFAYYQAPLRVILGDLLAAVGDALDSTADATLLASTPRHWLRAEGPAKEEIEVLSQRFGFAWRVLPSGLVWAGTEAWADSTLTDYTPLGTQDADGTMSIAADLPAVYPGQTFAGRHVQTVEHIYDSARLRTEVVFA